MATTPILDLPEYRALAGLTTTDATRDATLQMLLTETNDAIVRMLRQPLQSATYTEYIDAPPSERITLRYWPVTAITTVRVATGSGGDPSKFTSDVDWSQYTDWVLDTDQSDSSSRSAVLRSMRGYWSISSIRPVNRLATRSANDPKAIQVVYTAGYDQIPSSLKSAALLIVGRLFLMRRGLLPGSASLNGGSYSYQTYNTAQGLLADPTVQDYLRPFSDISV